MLFIIRLDLTPAQIDGINAYNRAAIADAKKRDPDGKGPERTTLPTHEWVKAGLLHLVADHIPATEPTATEKADALAESGDLKGAIEVLKAELSAKAKGKLALVRFLPLCPSVPRGGSPCLGYRLVNMPEAHKLIRPRTCSMGKGMRDPV